MKVADIGNALPSASRRFHRPKAPASQQPMPKSLPACFAEVWRRRKSTLPVHRRERATLEAVAATIPADAAGLTGSAAAAVYLAALVVSLERLVQTTNPAIPIEEAETEIDPQNLSKKQRKQTRRQQREAEKGVKEMTTTDVLRPMMKPMETESMKVDNDNGMKKTDQDVNTDPELVASLMYLISSALEGCSPAVLRAKGVQILDVVVRAMNHVSGYGLAARHASTSICQMLSVLDASSWSKPVIQRSYLYLVRLTTDSDAKSRKKAREALHQLLSGPRASLIGLKTSAAASSHYIAELKVHMSALNSGCDSPGNSLPVALVHILTSIEQFAVFLRPQDAAKVAKEIVLVASKPSQSVSSFALLALWSLMKHRIDEPQSESASERSTSFLPSKDIAKLLTAVLRYEIPEDSSDEWRIAYCSCVADGAIAYADYFTHTPPPLEFVSKPVLQICGALKLGDMEKRAVVNVTTCLRRMLSHGWFMKRPIVLETLQEFIDIRYRYLWSFTVPLVKKYLEQELTAGNIQVEDAVISLLRCVLAKRDDAKRDEDWKSKDMAESVLSSVIRGGGAEKVLTVVSVQYDAKHHVSNAWILPFLLNNLRGAPLSLFFQQFRPLADKLRQLQQACRKQKRVVEAKNIGMYMAQVWNLLPGFCCSPPDVTQEGILSETFKSIHFCMTAAGDNDMINIGAGALRQLAVSIRELSANDPTVKQVSSSFASRLKKLFPTISQVAENVPDENRLALLRAVTVSCQASENPTFVSSLLKKNIRRLLELQLNSAGSNGDASAMTDKDFSAISRAQHASADLSISIIESRTLPPDAAELILLEKAVSPFLMDPKESALQKKAYRSAALLVSLRADANDSSELLDFASRVAAQSKTVAPGVKSARQGLVVALIDRHTKIQSGEERATYLQAINDGFLSEILLGTRDASERTRAASFSSLVALARGWHVCIPGNDMGGLQRFFTAVAAGLAGKTVSMLAAALTSLGRLIYDFRGEATMSEEFSRSIDSLFAISLTERDEAGISMDQEVGAKDVEMGAMIEPGPVAILLRHNAVEVQKAALGIIKVATKALSQPPTQGRLNGILPGIIPGLVHVAARSKKQETRLKVRVILERLLRRCGREALEYHFPPEHAKLLAAVRKKYSRELLRKHAEKENRAKLSGVSGAVPGLASRSETIPAEDESDLDSSDSDVEREILDGDTLLSKTPVESKSGLSNNAEAAKKPTEIRNPATRNENGIRYTEDGKPIFVESDAESGDAEVGSIPGDGSGEEEGASGGKPKLAQTRKRKRSDPHDSMGNGKRMKGAFGEEYRGKRGRGDIKRPGRPDPFAYVPLGPNMLEAGARIGRSGSGRSKHGSSLRRLAGEVGTKKKIRRLGVPGRR